jgi:hypothetical protein
MRSASRAEWAKHCDELLAWSAETGGAVRVMDPKHPFDKPVFWATAEAPPFIHDDDTRYVREYLAAKYAARQRRKELSHG